MPTPNEMDDKNETSERLVSTEEYHKELCQNPQPSLTAEQRSKMQELKAAVGNVNELHPAPCGVTLQKAKGGFVAYLDYGSGPSYFGPERRQAVFTNLHDALGFIEESLGK